MDMALASTGAFLFGAFIGLGICFSMIFKNYTLGMNSIRDEFVALQKDMALRTEEFKAVTEKASLANQSLGQAIVEFDIKLKDMETRIAMTRMQR